MRSWEAYVEERFNAQKNLVQILRYQGAQALPDWFDPRSIDEFRISWEEKIDENARTGKLERDKLSQPILFPDGRTVLIIFVAADLTKNKVPKKSVRTHLLDFIKITTGMNGEQAFSRIELIPNISAILISYVPLEGSAKNEITEFNSILQYPIRHFTVHELQFDPTQHATGPKSVRVLSPSEVQAVIDRQKDIVINGRDKLVPDFDSRLEELQDENDKQAFIREVNAELLGKLPTINSTDPLVKWRGYNPGDVLEIIRRTGNTRVTYRRVVRLEHSAPPKPPKSKKVTTNK